MCTTTRSEVVTGSLDFFIKFAVSSLDKWLSYYESNYICYSATYNSPFCHHFRVRTVFSLNHLLLRLISSFRRIEISKQTNAKADDSNLLLTKICARIVLLSNNLMSQFWSEDLDCANYFSGFCLPITSPSWKDFL